MASYDEYLKKCDEAIDIIKNKNVAILSLKYGSSLEIYNLNCSHSQLELTQDEYDLLRELLCDE